MSEALTTRPVSLPVTAEDVERAKEQLAMFRQFVRDVLIPGVDFGRIPGTDKDTLLKPGGERICLLFGLTPTIEFLEKTVEFDREPPFFYYEIRCVLTHRGTGEIAGEGVGSSNSKETKHRYRWEWFNGSGSPTDSGWEQYTRRNNSKTWRRRTENLDTADVANTVLKIAKKRAFIDAVLTVSAASEFFTQDLDDFSEEEAPAEKRKAKVTKGGSKKAPTNEDKEACPDCNAPPGKNHGSKCPRRGAQRQDAEEKRDQTPKAKAEDENQDRCEACHMEGGAHAEGCPNAPKPDATFPDGDEV